ncbi:hypothetical protein ZYGR_0AD01440 [Zygosaccharomyces rouxii]|uniref:ZYRO0G09284p n=2 Tax=Zygosaccharomyces rouxii TaxID=4956 RepID=C5E028_ZYGRC|nr:uncharacterized protein ZYRO0G09284g [Zygosaccharomyces rouxii]KAH9202456.1 nucleotide-diphospho-sugar transferase [Zygosaccharomyces rouxii]GAV50961.1 hypothetical protein ZYGR_0AD01440 [Zygosaccharomyces rouxii]CAR29462.1 ZYRO0G09284p [Zygosaccharomyces rouxii]
MIKPLNKSEFRLDKRTKQIFFGILLLYSLVAFHLSNKKYAKFITAPEISNVALPTTSHVEQLNLKELRVKDRKLKDLREQLVMAFPYEPEKPIPRRIWQTWKVKEDSLDFPASFRSYQRDWTEAATLQGFEYMLVPDDNIEAFLQNLYGELPLVLKAFKEMPKNILKADFLRYLLLYARGGIYSDMDTFPLKPLNKWPSVDREKLKTFKETRKPVPYKGFKSEEVVAQNEREPGLVIGIEADPDRTDWSDWFARRIQFCQWTIQSKPGHPVLRELILNITATTLYSVSSVKKTAEELIDKTHKNDYNVNYRDKRARDSHYDHDETKTDKNVDGSDIMNWTGPGIFSDMVMQYLNNLIQNNNDVLLLNGNIYTPTTVDPAEAAAQDENGVSTKKFYRKIIESLLVNRHIPWEFFTLITEPITVDDLMILPITSFSPDVGQMNAKGMDDEMALVKHQFEGSWKGDAGHD